MPELLTGFEAFLTNVLSPVAPLLASGASAAGLVSDESFFSGSGVFPTGAFVFAGVDSVSPAAIFFAGVDFFFAGFFAAACFFAAPFLPVDVFFFGVASCFVSLDSVFFFFFFAFFFFVFFFAAPDADFFFVFFFVFFFADDAAVFLPEDFFFAEAFFLSLFTFCGTPCRDHSSFEVVQTPASATRPGYPLRAMKYSIAAKQPRDRGPKHGHSTGNPAGDRTRRQRRTSGGP